MFLYLGTVELRFKQHRVGAEPLVDPIEDLNIHPDMPGNSWFFVGHFEADGHTLNFMYHISVLQFSNYIPVKMISSILSITDETDKIYRHEDRFYKAKGGQVASKGLSIKSDKDYVDGNLDNMNIKVKMQNGSVEIKMRAVGYPLYNLCTGYFKVCGVYNYQFSYPTLESEGVITLDGKTYPVKGNVWLDRQYAKRQKGAKLKDGFNCRWVWMDLHFDNNEDKISLFGAIENATGKEYGWATVLHPNGTQAGVEIESLFDGASEVWASPSTGQKYPTRWRVRIPEWDTELDVISVMKEQEIVCNNDAGKKYEGASRFTGRYKGQDTSGYCCLELVGKWK